MITIAVADEGRHLFEGVRDSRVRLASITDAPCPDLIVFPCSRFRRFDNVSALTLPAATRAHIERRQVGLVFDSSLEGVPHKPDITAALHAVIEQHGAVPQQCVYVTQERQYPTDYRQHCAAIGVDPVAVMVHDYWIWFALSECAADGEAEFRRRLQAFRNREAHRPRKFVSLNKTPRPTKILFLLRLLHDRLWDQAFISFGGFAQKAHGPGKGRPSLDELRRTLPGFEDLVVELAPALDQLAGLGRVLLGLEQHGWTNLDLAHGATAVDLAEYDHSWFTVITETEMRTRPSRITEKVVKPLVNFHPFVVLGNPGALTMIREYGFVTFKDLFDESYDEVLDPRERFERVYEQVVRACNWSEQDWQQAERQFENELTFNAHRGLIELPTTVRRQQEPLLVHRILRAVRPG